MKLMVDCCQNFLYLQITFYRLFSICEAIAYFTGKRIFMISFNNIHLFKSEFFSKFLAGKILFPGLDPYFIYAIIE